MTDLHAELLRKLIISIHMPHTWHDVFLVFLAPHGIISIHMPHTWHDLVSYNSAQIFFYFNPHATYVA